MASKMYVAVICVLVCTVICIGCRKDGPLCQHGRNIRFRYTKMCLGQRCENGKWVTVKRECSYRRICYPHLQALAFNNTKYRCNTKGHEVRWVPI
ncbi:hypothetical protein PoB_001172600 [Plakobranchus ocellatus]|uniref:Secreted protein n=1 Tax=Plakobranchus ocellatus TaxID=259542 RepID=A0AAV3YD25_9GAST|nr:hypothetical protein PoB_001172600 [Plakobranchus ocellatus]